MNWYAVYIKSRCEKKVLNSLIKLGYEAFCPFTSVKSQWTDRQVKVEKPLLPSYLFVNILPTQFAAIRQVRHVVNFVYENGRIAVINDKEMARFKNYIDKYSNYKVTADIFNLGDELNIESQLLGTQIAKVLGVKNKTVEIILGGIKVRLKIFKNDE